jgi:hypothetical protein
VDRLIGRRGNIGAGVHAVQDDAPGPPIYWPIG